MKKIYRREAKVLQKLPQAVNANTASSEKIFISLRSLTMLSAVQHLSTSKVSDKVVTKLACPTLNLSVLPF